MEHIILGLLILKSMTIYEMNGHFKHGLSLAYSASYGSLQNGLKKLLNQNLITVEATVDSGRQKKVYQINKAGEEVFKTWMLSEIPLHKLNTLLIAKLYFLDHLALEDQLLLVSHLIEQTEAKELHLMKLEKESKSLNPTKEFQIKTLDYGMMAQTSSLHWLSDLHIELERKKTQ